MRTFEKVIVSCAVTGAIHTPTMSPYLPVTPEEIAEEAIAAADAGASIVHVHVRDPETGEPTGDLELFRAVCERVADACDVVIQPTTGGALTQSIESRIRVVPELEPEMASCNVGSINFGLYPLVERYEPFEYDWERPYLERTRDFVFTNTFADLETVLPAFAEAETKPELECYDVGHLYNAKAMVERGLLAEPVHIQFVLGIHGGIGADPANLVHLYHVAEDLFGDAYSFSVVGAGRSEFPLTAQAVAMGGHARVGLEDNLYLGPGRLAESNADLVGKLVRIASEQTGRKPATPAEVRAFFDLKGADATAI
ncbi:beta-keto acid cleavage family enzyme [Natronobiforma cellulositropha]|uniref:3-keto-5-aminohexanoate cleavage protein n=1 Tax=Natronobiforma cellulositropha TaxID=1679076 RepID=UPI0021D5AC58|nr:3-keto-5-aminohexanoate cleavage protein [Natronobiforma cellulositropha]